LPIGTQLVASVAREGLLIRVAAQLEAARPWRTRVPPIHGRALTAQGLLAERKDDLSDGLPLPQAADCLAIEVVPVSWTAD
jgi:hypothetical protein